jgi:chromosome segregation ATPase
MTDDINEKLDKFSSILEKFGLDIITKMGQTNLKINQLTDKVNALSKATLDVKSLSPQLGNIIENQKVLEEELELLRTLIANLKNISPATEEEIIERDETATDKKDEIISQLKNLKVELDKMLYAPKTTRKILEKIKEEIFEFTGGHRMLHEISRINSRLNSAKSLDDLYDPEKDDEKTLNDYLEEKIPFWINKLMVKD